MTSASTQPELSITTTGKAMDSNSKARPLSCMPCAKRKVRCDRHEPCSHCKRRNEVCEYPVPLGRVAYTTPEKELVRKQQMRIAELERSIAQTSGDSRRAFSQERDSLPPIAAITDLLPSREAVGSGSVRPFTSFESTSIHGKKRSFDGTPRPTIQHKQPLNSEASLVEYNKGTAFIDSPVWYSWNEARKPGNEARDQQQETNSLQSPYNNSFTGYNRALLDEPAPYSTAISHKVPSYRLHPPAQTVYALWDSFLTNVHPVVKIFFDWEKRHIVDIAARDPAGLSHGQQALCFATYFITVLSLTEEECKRMIGHSQTKEGTLDEFQKNAETALLVANYASTCDIIVLQAFILYLLAMRNRAKPATSFAMMGVAVRIAQRLGLHKDGISLGLSPLRTEERRRIWWQMQHMEILVSILLGCISLTLYAQWDVKLPANLEDDDMGSDMISLPPDRNGLTSMSHCMWRYHVIYSQRIQGVSPDAPLRMMSQQVTTAERNATIELVRRSLAEKFLQYCDILNPLHVHIQVGIQNFLLAMQRASLQPGLAGVRISEMTQSNRDELLQVCVKAMEYCIFAETNTAIAHFKWHNENYFQWTALVYIVIEVHHRSATSEALALWKIINNVCEVHPKLTSAVGRPEVYAIARLIILAWQQRQHSHPEDQRPWCVDKLESALAVAASVMTGDGQAPILALDEIGTFDFDLIDWNFWETAGFAQGGQ